MQNNTPTINSDYSEFITDRFNKKTPTKFIDDLFVLVMNNPKLIADIKMYFNIFESCHESVDAAQRYAISINISKVLFFDVFGLRKHMNEDTLDLGSFLNREYPEHKIEIDSVIDDIKSYIFA